MAKYIMALDSSTTSNRCILFDHSGQICSVAQKEFTQYFPQPGWVEHDAEEIFSTQLEVARQAMHNIGASASDIAAIGITNQRETTVVWNKHTGKPICNAIVWQCRRTAAYCDHLRSEGLTDTIREKTGLVIDPYFLRDQNPLDSRAYSRCQSASTAGRFAVWHRGNMADLEADRW